MLALPTGSTNEQAVPDWIAREARRIVPLLGLSDWHITASMASPDPSEPEQNHGLTVSEPRYLEAHIQFSPRLRQDDYGMSVVAHELLEVRFSPLDLMVQRIVGLIDNERVRETAQELWVDAAEQVTETLARALQQHLAHTALLQAQLNDLRTENAALKTALHQYDNPEL
jgi:hypothetical protein